MLSSIPSTFRNYCLIGLLGYEMVLSLTKHWTDFMFQKLSFFSVFSGCDMARYHATIENLALPGPRSVGA